MWPRRSGARSPQCEAQRSPARPRISGRMLAESGEMWTATRTEAGKLAGGEATICRSGSMPPGDAPKKMMSRCTGMPPPPRVDASPEALAPLTCAPAMKTREGEARAGRERPHSAGLFAALFPLHRGHARKADESMPGDRPVGVDSGPELIEGSRPEVVAVDDRQDMTT